ncbi:EAL domain-containing protein [Salinisphaera sp. SPP-AMP-43]|uniref:sensor domain-containing protein n=1 Tax=Salinisphaera sp. SPP-AMP-43 TaxID=3121288 RepID=UPI003C6DFBA5
MKRIAIDVLDQHAQGGTWSLDAGTGELWWSDGIYAVHKLDPRHFTPSLEAGLSFFDPPSQAALREAVASGDSWNMFLRLIRADGVMRHVHSIGQAEQRPGQATITTGLLLDVEHIVVEQNIRRGLEQRLAEQQQLWRLAGESAGLGLLQFDFDDDLYRVMGGFARRIGLSRNPEVTLPRRTWDSYVHLEDQPNRQASLKAHIDGQSPVHQSEYRLCLPNAEPLWIKEIAGLVEDEASSGPRLIGVLSDISERKAREQEAQRDRQRLADTLANAPIGIALIAPTGEWLHVNHALCAMLGYTEAELMARSFRDITHPEDLPIALTGMDDMLAGRLTTRRSEKRYLHKAGQAINVQLDMSLLHDGDDRPLHFICHIQDITERKRSESALFEAKELAEVTFGAIGEGLIRVDRAGRINQANPAAQSLLGVDAAALLGQRFADCVTLLDAEQDRQLPDPVDEVLRRGQRLRVPIFTRLKRQDGCHISIVDSVSPIHNADGLIRGAVFVFQDVSETHRMTDELVYQANHDVLTALPNRRGFEEAVTAAWQRSRSGAGTAYLFYIDIDRFKIINDTHGHAAGDELLKHIAHVLRARLPCTALLARLAGDEFAAVVFVNSDEQAQFIADKLIRAIADLKFIYAERPISVGASIGITLLDGRLASPEQSLIHGDAALYTAKNTGRGRHYLFGASPSVAAQAQAYMDSAQLLHSGLEQDRFKLYLQAIVDASGNRVGYEALLRFQTEDALVGPAVFMDTAKSLGLMLRIDRWVVNAAVQLIRDHCLRDKWPKDHYLSVNLTPASLTNPMFHKEILETLDARTIPAGCLSFEITESEELTGDNYPLLVKALRARGFTVWLDDFASGYNSFDMLKRISVDGIKIDRSFVQDIESDPIDRAVIGSIADISASLSLDVIAEGVETAAMLDVLVKKGFTRFQGYYFHRPAPAAEVLAAGSDYRRLEQA